jgi:hypothetical protein
VKAISIQQPWAWAILTQGKDVENRDWPTKVRGRVLVHVGKKFDDSGVDCLYDCYQIQTPIGLPLGGIIGSVEIVALVTAYKSPWFYGKFGFILQNPKVIPFIPYKGRLGFFDVPDSIIPPEAK